MADITTYYSGINKNKILKAVNSVLSQSKAIDEFGLIFVSVKKMTEFNKKHRGLNRPTNVLSFATKPSDELGSGDVVVCPDVIKLEAKEYGFTQKKWMTRLIVHGILHLVGYDHQTRKRELEMKFLEEKVFDKLNI